MNGNFQKITIIILVVCFFFRCGNYDGTTLPYDQSGRDYHDYWYSMVLANTDLCLEDGAYIRNG